MSLFLTFLVSSLEQIKMYALKIWYNEISREVDSMLKRVGIFKE